MKLVIISVSNSIISEAIRVEEQILKNECSSLSLKLFFAGRSYTMEQLKVLENSIQTADFAVLDLMGAPLELQQFIIKVCKTAKGHIVPIGGENPSVRGLLKLGSLTGDDVGSGGMKSEKSVNPEAMRKMMDMGEKLGKVIPFGKPKDLRHYVLIGKYWRAARPDDVKNLFYLVLKEYGGVKGLPEPMAPSMVEETSICRPVDLKCYNSFEQYIGENTFDPGKPTVAVLYYGHSYPSRTSSCVAQVAERIGAFANILPVSFASATEKNLEHLKHILYSAAGRKVDLVINFMSFRLGAGPMGGDAEFAVDLLKGLNVPVLHPFFMYRRTEEEWKESSQGINPSEFLITVMLPELDGCVETFPIGDMGKANINETHHIEISELELIEERVERLTKKVKNWLKLQSKSMEEKKVAIICYNYPPGEDNLFGGAFLDTFLSVENLQKAMIKEGYTLELLKAEKLMEHFAAGKLVNSGRWSGDQAYRGMLRYGKDEYGKALGQLPMREELVKQWGKAPGEIMTEGNDFLIPGIVNGNVFIGLQPSRGVHEDPEKAYHDKGLLPHHQYMAFYKWLKEEFEADVIVHVGTHGTLEFLKGKECGMSGDCLPDMLVSDIPHGYLYYTGNPAEAMIAKRRSHAVLVGYQPPVFMEGELYGELSQLDSLINEFHEAERMDPARCKDVEQKIICTAQKIKLDGNHIKDLERELYRMKQSLMPRGLHVFGDAYTKEEALEFVKFALRYDRGGVKAVRRIAAELEGLDYDRLLDNNQIPLLSSLDGICSGWIEGFLKTGKMPELRKADQELKKQLKAALEYGGKIYSSIQECHELEGFIKVLSGEYLPARLAGDMIRNPEVLPSGYNLYQFDPRLVPSEAAAERGARIARNTLEQHKQEYGTYPKSTAVIMWGLETSRTQGETIGQILHYLGVRVSSRKNLYQSRYEIIPLEELGRPRIDVVINICGFFRDMFPNVIEDLDRVFRQIAELDEPDGMNYFKSNSRSIYTKLIGEGYTEEEAKELYAARFFGPAEAEYGTGITRLIETKNWTSESDIGEAYIKSLKHIYSKSYRGKAVENLFETHLEAVDIVSQVRSSHEYEVTDLDHYYEFFGGLSKSVEMAKGKKAVVYITDTTGERIETETVDKSITRGVRTRLLNPKWIDAMLEHKYHGVQKISDRFENILGLAATTNKVHNWIFSSLHDTYVSDEEMRNRLKENNRWAYYSMVETLLETSKRGYWEATSKELDELVQVYLSLEADIEDKQ